MSADEAVLGRLEQHEHNLSTVVLLDEGTSPVLPVTRENRMIGAFVKVGPLHALGPSCEGSIAASVAVFDKVGVAVSVQVDVHCSTLGVRATASTALPVSDFRTLVEDMQRVLAVAEDEEKARGGG